MLSTTACISFSSLRLRFTFPTPVELTDAFLALQCEDDGPWDAEFEIRLLTEPLTFTQDPVPSRAGLLIYPTERGELRIYTPLIAEDGCQVACFLCSGNHHILYYPASRWEFYTSPLRCMHLICGEMLLLQHDAMLLHSSVVMHQGRMVLFSGPSGAGKSTQARLWVEHLGAEVINGDRCVIMQKEDGFYGGGSPWSGTSGIYRPEQAPIAGIVLIEQAPVNQIRRMGFDAFMPLFTQTIINSWDSRFMDRITHLFEDLLAQVPVYHLQCRPDEEAVELVRHTLFD